jgi:hypothetical protein
MGETGMLTQQNIPYTPPILNGQAFNCPHCQAYANHVWGYGCIDQDGHMRQDDLRISTCTHCQNLTIWLETKMLYPMLSIAPPASPDLPEDIRGDYEEARAIVELSPRGAAALLRLAIQKLCKHLQ